MNILFVSAVLPFPLHSGGQVRTYNLIKRLSRQHSITLVSFIRSQEERQYKKNLEFCHNVHMVMRGRAWQPRYMMKAFGKFPFLLATYDNDVMQKTLDELLTTYQFDLLHIEPFYVWPSIPNTIIPIVVSEHNIEYEVYKKFTPSFFWWDTMKLKYWEQRIWKNATKLTAVSVKDAKVMEKHTGQKVAVVPNGVNLDTFRFRLPNITDHPTILFVGNFRWRPNREAARTLLVDIWPKITHVFPRATLWIVGKDMPNEFQKFAISADDIVRVYYDADILVAPHAIGGGTKFKILEAMATGLPIVTTKAGVSGLAMKAGVHYLEAERREEFVDQITRVCDNRSLAEEVAKNSRKLIESTYTWDTIAEKLEYVWKNA